MAPFEHRLERSTPQPELLALLGRINRDPAIHGILVQLPPPPHIDEARVIAAIDPAKDVDGFHTVNAGLLATAAKVRGRADDYRLPARQHANGRKVSSCSLSEFRNRI
jgi:5,10-methylene-tetrahydrofolate dehydrogenase/methenyl tetrahydrofolate cyclohydrolase